MSLKQGDIVLWIGREDLGYFLVIGKDTSCRSAFENLWPKGCARDGELDIIRLEDGQVYSEKINELQLVQVIMVP